MKMLIAAQPIILLMMWTIMYTIKFKKKYSSKPMSPFECGYNPFTSKMPMSIQFTLIIFIFLLFDVELSILISWAWTMTKINENSILTLMIFLSFMLISILYEMMKKAFKWT